VLYRCTARTAYPTQLEELCNEVAKLQEQLVDLQDAASAARTRDEWWTCMPSLAVARPTMRMLLDRAAASRVAHLEQVSRPRPVSGRARCMTLRGSRAHCLGSAAVEPRHACM
jgi:hypothetical protein